MTRKHGLAMQAVKEIAKKPEHPGYGTLALSH